MTIPRIMIGLMAAAVLTAGAAFAAEKKPEDSGASKGFSGRVSYYDKKYSGRTASGEQYDAGKLTAAHRDLPFGTKLLVTDVRTGRTVTVIVNDRGPFRSDRVLDLSYAAAIELKMIDRGIITVRAEVE